MPSDIYQAQALVQLALRFNWTWIGAVVANNDYGHMAVKVFRGFDRTCVSWCIYGVFISACVFHQVFEEETQGKGVCLAFVETLQRETIVRDARRAALTIQASTAMVILVFSWYTDVRELFHQLHAINVRKAPR